MVDSAKLMEAVKESYKVRHCCVRPEPIDMNAPLSDETGGHEIGTSFSCIHCRTVYTVELFNGKIMWRSVKQPHLSM